MQKIPTLFLRDPEDMRYLTTQVHPDCQWVLDGEGTARRKYDGTCVMLDDGGRWWARREVKPDKMPPPYFLHVGRDETTGKTMGYEPIGQSSFARFHLEALGLLDGTPLTPGTYELCGPKINGNPEGYPAHELIAHATAQQIDVPDRSFEGLFALLVTPGWVWEGIVFHHPDGRMAKIKARDFG